MGEKHYTVGVEIREDNLDQSRKGYIASVSAGHPKVLGLFAFGDNREEARSKLARTIAEMLADSRYNLTGTVGITLVVPRTYSYPLTDLGIPDA